MKELFARCYRLCGDRLNRPDRNKKRSPRLAAFWAFFGIQTICKIFRNITYYRTAVNFESIKCTQIRLNTGSTAGITSGDGKNTGNYIILLYGNFLS